MNVTARHPGDRFRFCPACAAEALEFPPNGRLCNCAACGFRFFFNCAAAAAAFIFHGERIILTVRAHEPRKGALDLPGGFLDYEETVEEALRREIREELAIETSSFRYLTSAPNDYLYGDVLYKTADLYFTCQADDIAGIRAGDDASDFVLVEPGQLDPARLAFPSSVRALQVLRR